MILLKTSVLSIIAVFIREFRYVVLYATIVDAFVMIYLHCSYALNSSFALTLWLQTDSLAFNSIPRNGSDATKL